MTFQSEEKSEKRINIQNIAAYFEHQSIKLTQEEKDKIMEEILNFSEKSNRYENTPPELREQLLLDNIKNILIKSKYSKETLKCFGNYAIATVALLLAALFFLTAFSIIVLAIVSPIIEAIVFSPLMLLFSLPISVFLIPPAMYVTALGLIMIDLLKTAFSDGSKLIVEIKQDKLDRQELYNDFSRFFKNSESGDDKKIEDNVLTKELLPLSGDGGHALLCPPYITAV